MSEIAATKANEDFMRGYQSAIIDTNGYTHARVMKILMFIAKELESFTKPESLQTINDYAQGENK